MKITKKQAIELGILTEKEAVNGIKCPPHMGQEIPKLLPIKEICVSEEFVQDMRSNAVTARSVRLKLPATEQVVEWQEANKQLDEMDWEAARNRVTKLDRPYED